MLTTCAACNAKLSGVRLAMNSRSRYAADIIVNFTAAVMKPHGGETPGSIRPRRHAHCGLRHIPCRLAKVTGLLMPGKLQPVTRWIGSLEGNQRKGPPNASQKEPSKTSSLSATLSAKPGAIARARACRRCTRNAAAATGTTGRADCRSASRPASPGQRHHGRPGRRPRLCRAWLERRARCRSRF